jgi:hypothetical protein
MTRRGRPTTISLVVTQGRAIIAVARDAEKEELGCQ